jgi:hypothetical protein
VRICRDYSGKRIDTDLTIAVATNEESSLSGLRFRVARKGFSRYPLLGSTVFVLSCRNKSQLLGSCHANMWPKLGSRTTMTVGEIDHKSSNEPQSHYAFYSPITQLLGSTLYLTNRLQLLRLSKCI